MRVVGGKSIKHINPYGAVLAIALGWGEVREGAHSSFPTNCEQRVVGTYKFREQKLLCVVFGVGGILGGKNTLEISNRNI